MAWQVVLARRLLAEQKIPELTGKVGSGIFVGVMAYQLIPPW